MTAIRNDATVTLARTGWCVLKCALEPDILGQIEDDLGSRFAATPLCEGPFYGRRTRRFGALLARSRHIEQLVMHPLILGLAEHMLLPWCERIALNLTQAIEISPGALPQLPHRDQDMWQGPKGCLEYLVNVMWPLDHFTVENGGTRLWTGSHRDQDAVALPEQDAVVPAVSPGDALIFLGSTLHGGGGNVSPAPRRGIVVSYCLGWLKPFELQWLVYPKVALRLMVAHAIAGSHLWNVKPEPQTSRNEPVAESVETCAAEAAFDEKRRAVLAMLGGSPDDLTVTGGNGDDYGLAGLFLRLLDLPDRAVMDVIAIVIGETLAAGSAAVEAVGLQIGVDMARYWQADDAFFELIRDKEVLTRIVAEVGGEAVASANAGEKTKTMKTIVRDHLTGENGRAKVEGWVPKWMAFPPSAYTERGGVGTVEAHALVEAARQADDEPDPSAPASAATLPEPERLAA